MQQVGQGGTITLRVMYETGSGGLVDPTSPAVAILRPDDTVAATGTPIKESTGIYYFVRTVGVSDVIGEWKARFTGTINGVGVTGDDPFQVVTAGVISPVAATPLVSLSELKSAIGVDQNDLRDNAQLTWAIDAASTAIRSYTDRDFGLPATTEQRSFDYDASGWLDIDDATVVTSVVHTIAGTDYPLSADEWATGPTGGAIYSYINLPTYLGTGSPEMGFKRNLDVAYREGRLRSLTNVIKVDGTWGWPVVPLDVKQAAVWTAMSIKDNAGPWLTESIEGYSRTIGRSPVEAIPPRAEALLDPYARWKA